MWIHRIAKLLGIAVPLAMATVFIACEARFYSMKGRFPREDESVLFYDWENDRETTLLPAVTDMSNPLFYSLLIGGGIVTAWLVWACPFENESAGGE